MITAQGHKASRYPGNSDLVAGARWSSLRGLGAQLVVSCFCIHPGRRRAMDTVLLEAGARKGIVITFSQDRCPIKLSVPDGVVCKRPSQLN